MKDYYAQDFNSAITHFKSVKAILTSDKPADNMLERCHDFLIEPPPADWNGVKIMKTK
ncbi:MAG: adenylate/guanylate cyclase domain-containing protein, partial [Spirochaetaceae bacterium]